MLREGCHVCAFAGAFLDAPRRFKGKELGVILASIALGGQSHARAGCTPPEVADFVSERDVR